MPWFLRDNLKLTSTRTKNDIRIMMRSGKKLGEGKKSQNLGMFNMEKTIMKKEDSVFV